MEQGAKNWSDEESDDGDTPRSRENRPSSEPTPERKPVFDLGIIYNRHETLDPEPIFQERDPQEPEVAQGITAAAPEFARAEAPPPTPEQARVMAEQQLRAQAEASDDDDDEEEDEEKERDQQQSYPVATSRWEQTIQPAEIVEPPEPEPRPTHVPPVPVRAVTQSGINQADQRFVGHYPAPPPPTEQFPSFGTVDGGGNQPPTPPTERPVAGSEPESWQQEVRYAQSAPQYNTYPLQQQQSAPVERYRRSTEREKAVAPWVVLAALTGYFFGRRKVKPLQEQVTNLEQTVSQRDEHITQLEQQQLSAQRQVQAQEHELRRMAQQHEYASTPLQAPSGFEHAAVSTDRLETVTQPAFTPVQERLAPSGSSREQGVVVAEATEQPVKVIGENGQEIVLQPGQRLVRRAGEYSIVFDEHNRVVQDAIHYGESYKQDRLPERMPTPFGSKDARFTATVPSGGGGGAGQPVASQSGQPVLPSGQVPQGYALPTNAAGQSANEEAQHLLNAPKRNPIIAAIISPWLWLGVGILLIAFFVAATI